MKILRVDASPKANKSNSRMLADHFIARLTAHGRVLTVDRLDLAENPPSHVSADFARATYTPAQDRDSSMRAVLAESDALCARVMAADALVCAMPMYNWSMPSTFKAFIDVIVRTGLTYGFTADGGTQGYLGDKKVLFITTRGADLRPGSRYADMDALTPALRAAFSFLGVTEPEFVNAEPMEFANPEQREQGIERARAELAKVAQLWLTGVVPA